MPFATGPSAFARRNFSSSERSGPARVISNQQIQIGRKAEICFSAHALCLTAYFVSGSRGSERGALVMDANAVSWERRTGTSDEMPSIRTATPANHRIGTAPGGRGCGVTSAFFFSFSVAQRS